MVFIFCDISYPLELLGDGYMSFLYKNLFPMRLAGLVIDIIINSVYVSTVLGIVLELFA